MCDRFPFRSANGNYQPCLIVIMNRNYNFVTTGVRVWPIDYLTPPRCTLTDKPIDEARHCNELH